MMASIYACVDWLKTRNSPAASTICDRTDDPVSTRIQKKRPSLFPLFSYNSHFLSSPSTRALSYAHPTRFNFCFVFSGALYVPLYIRWISSSFRFKIGEEGNEKRKAISFEKLGKKNTFSLSLSLSALSLYTYIKLYEKFAWLRRLIRSSDVLKWLMKYHQRKKKENGKWLVDWGKRSSGPVSTNE